jgi:pimeloyl-ACP methyl ester carboxylesterase/lysophospholipase L1-like esterase
VLCSKNRLSVRIVTTIALVFSGLLLSPFSQPQAFGDAQTDQTRQSLAAIGGDQTKFDQWHGFLRCDFVFDSRNCIVVAPNTPAEGKPWIWRARFFGHEPQTDIALLNRGFHLVYMDVVGMFGNLQSVSHWNAFYDHLVNKHGFAPKVALEGMSRGGLNIFNWAKANPTKVSCIYADAPVCDIRSWPGGSGDSEGSPKDWQQCMKAHSLTAETAKEFKGNPIDGLEPLAKAGVPLLHVCGATDEVVPMAENTDVLESRYRQLGGSIRVIRKAGVGHHPHSLADPSLIVNFVLAHTVGENDFIQPRSSLSRCADAFESTGKGRVAFLGGSITEMEGYRPRTYQTLQKLFPKTQFDFINAGISSTASTTGAFRLTTDVFSRGTVDLLFVEFAVNDDQDALLPHNIMIRAMEGIVLQARRHNPKIDIVFLYTANEHHIETYQAGKTPLPIVAHQQVAEYYGIPSISFAGDVAQRMGVAEFDWKTFGGTHPAPYGADIYASDIATLLAAHCRPNDPAADRPQPTNPLDPLHFGQGRFIAIEEAKIQSGWTLGKPDWDSLAGGKRKQFSDIPMLVGNKPGASLDLKFKGSTIGLYMVSGPDAGTIEYTIDDKPYPPINLFTKYSKGLHYPWTCLLETNLSPGQHTLRLSISDQKDDASTGNAVRIKTFVGN